MKGKIFHHNDADGRCAAWIMARHYRETGVDDYEFIEMDYGMDIQAAADKVKFGDIVSIVDFSFKPDIMNQIIMRAGVVVWCDHHVTAKDYVYIRDVMGVRDFNNKGLSGCECTWRFCYPDIAIPYFVRLLGDYDAWRLENDPECFEFFEGIKMNDCSPDGPLWSDLYYHPQTLRKVMSAGHTAIRYRDSYCDQMNKQYGYDTVIQGHKTRALNIMNFGSKGFGTDFHDYPLCVSYAYDGTQFKASLYSEHLHCGEIAAVYGGGGHQGAAGFICDHLPFTRSK